MGFGDWAHRVGKFFDSVKDDMTGPVNKDLGIGSAVGAAWSAASNWKMDDDNWFAKPAQWTDPVMEPIQNASKAIVGGAGDALHFAYTYGVARNVSTANQMITRAVQGDVQSLTSAEAWNEAYNRSEEISLGQSAVAGHVNIADRAGFDIGPNWMKDGTDTFGPENAKNREDFYHNTWHGKLSSGSIDAIGIIAADPGYLLLKGANKAQRAKITVDGDDTGAVLAKASETGNRQATDGFDIGVKPKRELEDGTRLSRRQADQGQRASQFIDRVVAKDRRELQAMPELQGHADANSLAILMQRAKDTHAGNPQEMRKAIADVLGTAWGDSAAMTRLAGRRDALATDMERLTMPPPQNLWSWRSPDYKPIADKAAERAVTAQRASINDELARLDEVIQHAATSGPARVGSTAFERAAEGSALRAVNESWLNTGFASAPIRMVTAMAGTRIPDHIRTKDAAGGYDDMVNTLRLMRYTPAETKQKLMDSFVRASSPAHRMNVVDMTRNQIVIDAAKKYELSPEAAKKLIATGDGRMESVRNSLRSRLYSAADDSRFVEESDAEDDIIHAFDKPFLKTMLEDAHPIIDPREVDDAIRIASRSRILDNAGAPGTAVADGFGSVKDVAADVLNMSTKLWKTAALARGAYPLRVMTDTQARQMAHMETQQFMMTRWEASKGFKRYLLSSKDGDEQKFSNIFKSGDLEKALTGMLTRDLGHGSQWNLTPEDVPGIVRNVMSRDGGMADLANEVSNVLLKKRRNGDFSSIEPNNPEWKTAYLRAVNRQILQSPVAVQALATPDIHTLKQLVRSKPALRKEARDVGIQYEKQEDWLRAVVAANNHLLPTPELRVLAMKRAARKGQFHEREVAATFAGKKPKVKPMPVHGEGFSVIEQGKTVASYNKARNGFFKIVAEIPENIAGRSPLFWDSYRKQIAGMLARLDEDQIATIGVDVIRKNAMVAARKDVARILFDSSHSSNMASSMRLLSPFFSAWEDTMTKWGKLFYDNPEMFARVNHGSQGLTDSGYVQDQNGYRIGEDGHAYKTDGTRADLDKDYEKGSQYVLLPKSLTKYTPLRLLVDESDKKNQGGNIRIRKDSINSVFQGEPWWLPGSGPMVAVPTNHIVREMFPKEVEHPILKFILPYGTTNDSEAKQLLPKWMKTASNALGTSQQYNQQYKVYLAEAVIDERNGGPKVDLDKLTNKTRNHFIMKAFVDFNSPVSIMPSAKNQFYIDKAHEYRADKTRKDWSADFDKDFPGFGEMRLELSTNETGIQATDMAWDEQKKYAKDIDRDPENGWMYVGPANAAGQQYNGAVHDWQVSHGYRTQKKPYEALQQLQANQGWDEYSNFRTAVSLELEARGLVSLQQKGAEDLQFALKGFREDLAASNAAWGEAINSGGGGGNKPQILLDKAQAFMQKHKEVRTRPDMVALQKYIDMRAAIKAELAQREYKSLERNPDLEYALNSFTQELVQDNFGFEQMYNRVLEYDTLEGDLG